MGNELAMTHERHSHDVITVNSVPKIEAVVLYSRVTEGVQYSTPAVTIAGVLPMGNRGGTILGLVQLWSLRERLVFQEYFCCIFAQAFIGATMWCV